MRLGLALATFFRVLFQRPYADQVRQLGTGEAATTPALPRDAPPPPAPARRSEAVTLLATLQREARFVDLVQESLDQYSDAQIGAAARDVLRDCNSVLARLFNLKPVLENNEGDQVTLSENMDIHRMRLTGNVSGSRPESGVLTHHGWEATHVELPTWNGSPEALRIVAPAEVEIK